MTLWVDACKMVAFASVLSFVLSIIAILLLGLSERSFLLFMPRPQWPVFVILAAVWCVSLKVAYWWFFEHYKFYGGK